MIRSTRRSALALALSLVAAAVTSDALAGKPVPPPPPPADPAIAFDSSGVMVMNADGSNPRLVVAGGSRPDWSPDHTQIVFSFGAQGNGIYVVNLDGTGLRKIVATSGGTKPVWSPAPVPGPTGKSQFRIAYYDAPVGGEFDLFIVNLDGTDRINVSNTPGFSEWFPTWSPDGSKVLCQVMSSYASGQTVRDHFGLMDFAADAYSIGAYGGALAGHWVRTPSWSKTQANLIAVEANVVWPAAGTRTNPSNYHLWLVKLDDLANPVSLTSSPYRNVQELSPSFSPDDSKIVFSRTGISGGDWIIDVTGANEHQLSSGGANPTWRRNP